MADKDDDTAPEEAKKGGGLLGAAGAVVGAYGGALGASHLMYKPERLAKIVEEAATKVTEATAEKTVKAAEKTLGKLEALAELNTKTGVGAFFKRPIGILKNGSMKAKFGIVGGAVALGALVYMGVKALRNRSASHVDRLEQDKQTDGTERSPG